MGEHNWMVYGANGYTGELIAEVAQRRGLSPILAGRRAEAVEPLADRLGMPHRVFSLDDPADLAKQFADVSAVLLAAGPFSSTSKPVVDACIASNTHYLDITGEIAVFEACHARDAEAKAANVVLMPGVGFDVVPSDCLALALSQALPSATSLELAFTGDGTPSKGTAKTMLENIGAGGAIRKDGVITPVPTVWREQEIPFRDRRRLCVTIPWGDVSTAFYSTGIPNIVVYTHMPDNVVRFTRAARPLLPVLNWKPIQQLLAKQIEKRVKGSDEQTRSRGRSQLWGRVTDDAGNSVEGTLVTLEGYRLTAEASVESTMRLLEGTLSGALTPSMAFGSRFIEEFDDSDLQIEGDAKESVA